MPSTRLSQIWACMAGSSSAARLLVVGLSAFLACRERVEVQAGEALAGADGGGRGGAPATDEPTAGGEGGDATAAGGSASYGGGGGDVSSGSPGGPTLVTCQERAPARACSFSGDASKGVRLIGTLLEPLVTRERGVLDIAADGTIRCAACDCGDAQGALVIDCPDLTVSPGFINLHDHLAYAGTPPLAHPGELYEHRSDWRLGENGHEALPFTSNASTAEVLAQELRMLMGG